jgi:hypothetical protein
MSSKSERGEAASVREALGADRVEQMALYEADLQRHEEALIDLGRTGTAIRGFAITAVAALVAAGFASGERQLGWLALLTAGYFAVLDFYWSRLDAEIRDRIKFLSGLAQNYRKALAGGITGRRQLLKLESDLRSFDPFGTMPSRPILWMGYRNWKAKKAWQRRQKQVGARKGGEESTFKPTKGPAIGPFKQFCFLYVILAAIASGTAIEGKTKPDEKIILCVPPGQVGATSVGLQLEGCNERPGPKAARRVRNGPRTEGAQPTAVSGPKGVDSK